MIGSKVMQLILKRLHGGQRAGGASSILLLLAILIYNLVGENLSVSATTTSHQPSCCKHCPPGFICPSIILQSCCCRCCCGHQSILEYHSPAFSAPKVRRKGNNIHCVLSVASSSQSQGDKQGGKVNRAAALSTRKPRPLIRQVQARLD